MASRHATPQQFTGISPPIFDNSETEVRCKFIGGVHGNHKSRSCADEGGADFQSREADFEIVEREIPKPGAGQVRIKVQACGVCHSDVLTKEGAWPGIQYPRVPGHEVAGVIDEVGAGVTAWKKGQRVGVGWHGGQDGTCLSVPPRRFSQLPESENSGHQL